MEIKRRKGESFESLTRRFSKRIQQSGMVLQIKKIRFHAKNENKNAQRKRALRRIEITGKRDWLIKTGRVSEEDFNAFQKRRK